MLLSSSKSFMLLAAVTMFGSMDSHLNSCIMQHRIISENFTDSISHHSTLFDAQNMHGKIYLLQLNFWIAYRGCWLLWSHSCQNQNMHCNFMSECESVLFLKTVYWTLRHIQTHIQNFDEVQYSVTLPTTFDICRGSMHCK